MSVLAIVRPLPLASVGGTLEGAGYLITPDPKEAAVAASAVTKSIDIDLGSVQTIDTIFIGYTSDDGSGSFVAQSGTVNYTATARGTIPAAPSLAPGQRRHFLQVAVTPYQARYIRLTSAFQAGYSVGVVAVGLAFRPTYGREYGSGRYITDTSSVQRLFGGGFGIDEGARVPGWSFTMGDLTDDEVDRLYAITWATGESRSILAIEDPDFTAGLNERIHWGLFAKIDAYERFAPGQSRWSLRVDEWA